MRVADRMGREVRTSARDALLADSAAPEARGCAFGFHAAADNAGAVLGPLVAFFILRLHGVGALDTSKHLSPNDEYAMRNVFWLPALPAAPPLVILVWLGDAVLRHGGDRLRQHDDR